MSALQIGLLIPIDPSRDNRAELLAEFAEGLEFPYKATLPCGNTYVLNDVDQLALIPTEGLPCPCGDGRHWLVRYG